MDSMVKLKDTTRPPLEPLIFEKSHRGKTAVSLSSMEVPEASTDGLKLRGRVGFPEVSELEVVRHYTRLSQLNFSIDTNFYPLGSCTMKYNPRLNEHTASMAGFAGVHPYQPDSTIQGFLDLHLQISKVISEVTGLDGVTLQPAAGAQGEFTGMLLIHHYLQDKGLTQKDTVIVPDSAHGTNPASAAMCGFKLKAVKTDPRGLVDMDHLRSLVDENTAALMLTNPNTYGLFEQDILEIATLIHDAGALLYYDGANLNAIVGKVRPGDMGFDVVHLNLHKSFSTPHGGGGPGAGPVACSQKLMPYLPGPRVEKHGETFKTVGSGRDGIGRVRGLMASSLVLVRALTYMLSQGRDGLPKVAEISTLNANYLRVHLEKLFPIAFKGICKHEFVLSLKKLRDSDAHITTLDLAKRLIDAGIHPPTVYFPISVSEALMIEPTETESKAELDNFIQVMSRIAEEVTADPDVLHQAPHHQVVTRLDEAKAVKEPCLVCIIDWEDE